MEYTKVKVKLPKNPKLMRHATEISVDGKILYADFEIKATGRSDKPELCLRIHPDGFEIEIAEEIYEEPKGKSYTY